MGACALERQIPEQNLCFQDMDVHEVQRLESNTAFEQ